MTTQGQMSNLANMIDIITTHAAEREARLAEQLRVTFKRDQDDVRVREERTSATVASTLKLPNEQQELTLVAHASSTSLL